MSVRHGKLHLGLHPSLQSILRGLRHQVPVLAALGDETRLSIVAKLSNGEAQSISQLTDDTKVTRQAVTKHLKVLEDAGIVRSSRSGRECHFTLTPAPLAEASDYLDLVSKQWDDSLGRLKAFVER
jgi:DNA-binding transcriptional ArsR family regulator